ncbi:3-oxo-5-alpha-steroid 4-dehydrogenase-like, putative [Trypanosoma brucei brucei TREU927]|uniref:3-oxo-5-alpha-steroid 4-dehydrogenase-like, putative n=1 Tax=Trypanosoma brucei brucei (strain 927/4 GUTat10.1) TaxID=185431 RepID=Q57XE1_TRYB2|nr:3-oxo-5-alpha-steroid 4-dehydrogenase-like, putative [Trypanosoma brucei brucei TREU927]AAX69711.1 3-oxo-5-alpha-steroid 4-dehydrogenase-like, putative [Trypanosoma brucei]AAZ13015.1 3-oxo-5-alpha-steroid 4-dehydrogenase-like, putative [Trypanosoma brucei brucei TREU927]
MMISQSHSPFTEAGGFAAAVTLLFTAMGMVILSSHLMPLTGTRVLELSSKIHLTMAAGTFLLLRFALIAPFGKHSGLSTVRIRVPALLSWSLQECPTLLSIIYYIVVEYPCYVHQCNPLQWLHMILDRPSMEVTTTVASAAPTLRLGLLFFAVHYFNRSVLYPLRVANHGTSVPLHITLSAMLYCALNGRLQLLANIDSVDASQRLVVDSTWQTILTILGAVIFFAGMLVNVTSDCYLIRLKKRPPLGAYKIPYGGLFVFVSCANFFGEIVEWFGYVAVVYGTNGTVAGLAALSFAAYVVANLLPRAYAHHQWYIQHFGAEYTALQRRAVIPFVY